MKKSHWLLTGFMAFNTACVVENAFPGWSALYASACEVAGGAFDLVAAVTDHWVNRHGIYLPTYPEFEFIAWSEASLYLTLGLLVRLLVKSELALRALRRERLEREMKEEAVAVRVSAAARSGAHPPAGEKSRKAPAPSSGRARRAAATEPGAEPDADMTKAFPIESKSSELAFVIEIAIQRGHWVAFDYEDRRLNSTRRWVRPLRVLSYRGEAYMTGFCRLRGEERTFRISRMSAVLVVPDRRPGSKTA
ncbi:MAG TPA: WYL domain-containing protein [Spirochaetota bacterium]|nr:WYL domain-containing protein [Spirochaetota bacterium]